MSKTIRDLLGGDLPEFPVIDIHAHMDRPAQFMCPGDPSIDGMVKVMDRVGIDRIAICPNMAINCDITKGNERVLRAAEKYPDRVIGLATVNFNRFEESMRSVEDCFQNPNFRGIKMHPDFMRYSMQDDEKMTVILDFLKAHDSFLISHTDARLYPGHLTLNSHPKFFIPYVERYPEVNFLMAHCGLTPDAYKTCLSMVQKYKNVYLDPTGFRFSNTWTVEDIARNGCEDQLVFGTDMPFNDVGSALCRVVLADLPVETRIKMLGANALRLLKED